MEEHNHAVNEKNERRTLAVIIITLVMMFAEIGYGYFTNSMSLLADGYHMGTHALALSLTYVAYLLSRKLCNSERFKNGTGKIGILAAYTSSLFLGSTGIWIFYEAIKRMVFPLQIRFEDAILVALIGLLVNGVCLYIMEYKNDIQKEKKDYNYMAAYYHILADALTSILAIVALLSGKFFNIIILDPIVGIMGGILILHWAYNLIKNTVKILIDME